MSARTASPLLAHLSRFCLIGLLGTALYSNTLEVPFVFDDMPNIAANDSVRLKELTPAGLMRASFESRLPTRPVANLSFALNYYVGQYRVRGYHLVNLAVHLCNAALVYLLSLLLLQQQAETQQQRGRHPPRSAAPSIALLAALLFVAHPVQTQTVTYIVQRMNGLAVMFLLVALLLYIQARHHKRTLQRGILYCGCLISWALALGSKEVAAILPVLVCLYEWFIAGSPGQDWLARNWKYAIGSLVLLMAAAVAYIGGNPLEGIARDYASRDFTLGQRVLTELRVVVFYISLLIWPHGSRLNLLHEFRPSSSLVEPITTLFSLLALASLAAAAIHLAQRKRLLSFCILWFFATLAIESSVVGLELVFEHRLYLPMVAVALLASHTLFTLLWRRPILLTVVAAALLASMGTVTYARNGVWRDEITLWSDVVAKNADSLRAHINLGLALAAAGRRDDAVQQYAEALRIDPRSAPARNNLGLVLRSQGRFEEAEAHFREVLRIDPDSAIGRENLGLTLAAQGRFEEAERHFRGLLRTDATDAAVRNDLGLVLAAQGRLEQAARQYRRALDIQPDFAEVYNNLGEVRARQGRFTEALEHFSAALRIAPDHHEAGSNLELVSQRLGESASGPAAAVQP